MDSPALTNNLSKTLEVTRTHKIRKQSGVGEKEEFFKKVQEKLGEREKNKKKDDFYRPDEADFESVGKDEKIDNESEKNRSANKADKEQVGSMGKSIDIKI